MNNSQRHRGPLPLYLQTRRVPILYVTQVLMYTSTVTTKEFIDIDIRGFQTKFRQRHVNLPKLRRGNSIATFEIQTGDVKNPPKRASFTPQYADKVHEKCTS